MNRSLAVGVVLIAVLVAGCAEFYRWPDRMARPARRVVPAPEGHYVVKAGDTMYSIAFRYQLDFRELAVWNDIGPDYLIHPGQVIRVSQPPVGEGIRTAPVGQPVVAAAPRDAPPPRVEPARPAESVARLDWRWPTSGAVVKTFGDGSKGVDLGGTLGQPVVAAAPGKVVYSGGALKGYGELIIIKHDDVHLSAYGYNRRRLVAEGAMVVAGQPIAELGLGPEQKPTLHFEIRRRGKPVDPKQFLPPA